MVELIPGMAYAVAAMRAAQELEEAQARLERVYAEFGNPATGKETE